MPATLGTGNNFPPESHLYPRPRKLDGLRKAGSHMGQISISDEPADSPSRTSGLLRAGVDKSRALLRLYFHSLKVRAAAKALAEALADSKESSSWPGDRLPVGAELSERVERLTHRLYLETKAHGRLAALFHAAGSGALRPA